jgi:acetyl-CoA acetyltransferase
MAARRDVAVVAFAQTPSLPEVPTTETQMLFPVITEAIEQSGIERRDIGFWVSGSCDYLAGAPFAFVSNLEATGAWPPIPESHVEMDGAFALFEAYTRLQHGDVDTALVFCSGLSSRSDLRETLAVQLDPYYLMPLWPDHISLAALQARAFLDRNGATERDMAEVAARSLRSAQDNPNAQVRGDHTADELLAADYLVEPLRAHDCPPVSDAAAAVVLAVGDRARAVCSRPAWIRGIDTRTDPHSPGNRDLAVSPSTRLAGQKAGVHNGPVEVAELCAPFTHQELIISEALELGDDVDINPSGGALAANPIMVAGLIRIGEAFRQINERGRNRVVAHATSGPCLQQNLVAVLEGE